MHRSFEILVRQARLTLLLERLWPLAVVLILLGGIFLILSFAGLWLVTPPLLKIAIALDDRPVDTDTLSLGLWVAYRAQLERAAAELKPPVLHFSLARKDPYALRFLVLLLLVATCFIAGPEKELRLRAVFDAGFRPVETVMARIDGWITPPAYTRRPPVMLFNGTFTPGTRVFSVPVGAVIHIQGVDLEIKTNSGLERGEVKNNDHIFTLKDNADLDLNTTKGSGHLSFHVIADQPPVIRLLQVEKMPKGKLRLTYKTEDDYGVVAAQMLVLAGSGRVDPQPLVPPPIRTLSLPSSQGIGDAQTSIDLTDHPWAGADVQLVLSAQDAAGHETRSAPLNLTLPEPALTNPLARAVMEQRLRLVLTPDSGRTAVQVALEAFLVAPDVFPIAIAPYLGLREASLMLHKARQPDALLQIVEILYDVALDLENKDLSAAGQALKAAEKTLREALKRHAPPDEIAALLQNLRDALAQLLREQAQNSGNKGAPSASARVLTPEDLKDMLDRLQDMAQSGNQAEVEALLDQLDELAQAQPQTDAQSPLDQAQDRLDRLVQDQQNLRDKTYREGLQPSDAAHDALSQAQKQLRQTLDALQKALGAAGESGDPSLDAAQKAMKQAEQALEHKKNDSAVTAQGKALEQLHRGIQNLAQRQADGQKGQGQKGQGQPGRDPLGRDSNGNGRQALGRESGRLQTDMLRRRIEDIYREIQLRAGQAQRPLPERNYLDRLLHDF